MLSAINLNRFLLVIFFSIFSVVRLRAFLFNNLSIKYSSVPDKMNQEILAKVVKIVRINYNRTLKDR